MQKGQYFDDEISLFEVFTILWARKKFILGVTFLLTMAAVVGVFFLPKIFEVSTIIEPGTRPITDHEGKVVGEKPVKSPDSIKEVILGGGYNSEIQEKLNFSPEKFPQIFVSIPKNTPLLKIKIESGMPHEALSVIKELVNLISVEVKDELEVERRQIRNDMVLAKINNESLLEKIVLIKKQILDTAEKIEDLEKSRVRALEKRPSDSVSILLYSNEIQNKRIYLNGLQDKLENLTSEAKKFNVKIENFQLKLDRVKGVVVNKKPAIVDSPIRPHKKVFIAVAFAFSFLGSTIAAFILEFFQRNKGFEKVVPAQ